MPDRDYWESLIDHCGLLGEMGVLDASSVFEFGVGYGSFLQCYAATTCAVAGIDIDAAMVEATRARLAAGGVEARVILGDFFDPAVMDTLPRFDVCLLMNILHHEEPALLVERACALLAEGGRLGVCHWRNDIETPRGPPAAMRIGREAVVALLETHGLRVRREGCSRTSPHHYFVVADTLRRDPRITESV